MLVQSWDWEPSPQLQSNSFQSKVPRKLIRELYQTPTYGKECEALQQAVLTQKQLQFEETLKDQISKRQKVMEE